MSEREWLEGLRREDREEPNHVCNRCGKLIEYGEHAHGCSTRYRTIVADPPWAYEGFATQSRTPGKWAGEITSKPLPYPSMTLEEIAALPVGDLAEKDARLFCWTTNRYLPDTFSIVEAWGFTYRQTMVWHKLDSLNGSVAPNAEFLLVAARGNPGRKVRLSSAVVSTAATKQHSRKPEVWLDLIEQVSPGPYLELFARRQRIGWDTWGNEALEHVQVSS